MTGTMEDRFDEAEELLQKEDFAGAERVQRQILTDMVDLRGPQDRATLMARGQLAHTLWHQGRYSEAGKEQSDLFATYKEKFGWDDVDTLGLAGHLLTTLTSQGRNEEAEALATELLPHQDRVFGGNSSRSLNTQQNLVLILKGQGKVSEAAEMASHVLELRISNGEDLMATASAYNMHGHVLLECAEYDGAERSLENAFDISKNKEGPEHPTTIDYLEDLGVLYFHKWEPIEAARIGSQVLEYRKSVLGLTHCKTIASMSNQSACLMALGRIEECNVLIDDAVELARQHLEEGNAERLAIISNAASIYRACGLHELAEELSRNSFELSLGLKGELDPETLIAMTEWCCALEQSGDLQAAIDIMKICVSRSEQTLGPNSRLTISRAKELARFQRCKDIRACQPYIRCHFSNQF